jgi:signal transduction histidine kinase
VINPAETDGHRPTAEELARLLAHDLRTPLNAVRGFADLLLVGAAGPLTAAAAGLVAEVARAGRALEVSIGLARFRSASRRSSPNHVPPAHLAGVTWS